MQYLSTRGGPPDQGFEDVLLTGLARDGGLFLPQSWPRFSRDEIAALAGLPYADLVARVVTPFAGRAFDEDELLAMARAAYRPFGHSAVAPLKQLDEGLWLMELFHGPTLAFKDHALQVLGQLFERVLARRGRRITIVGATSGDTGSAAIEALRGRDPIEIFMLHPRGRVSQVQRRQMTTVLDGNVHNVAIEGTFDDCQDLVKGLFNDRPFRDEMALSAVNSINWARIAAQIAYYFHAALALGAPHRAVSFAVPTGNFGNVYAAFAAKRMGLPIERLIIGSNSNDVLTRFLEGGRMSLAPVAPTLSPSMDIQISSNFERLLFDLHGRDGAAVTAAMNGLRRSGAFTVTESQLAETRALFGATRCGDEAILAEIARCHDETGELLDPHSAVGVAAARAQRGQVTSPIVSLACAHPAKFPDAVERASGLRPDLPARLADLHEREERCDVLPADLAALQTHIRQRLALRGAA